jgi:hypothetical protein
MDIRKYLKKFTQRKKKKEREKDINSGHFILPAMTKSTVHTLLGPKYLH